jgi:hypothetical protein
MSTCLRVLLLLAPLLLLTASRCGGSNSGCNNPLTNGTAHSHAGPGGDAKPAKPVRYPDALPDQVGH